MRRLRFALAALVTLLAGAVASPPATAAAAGHAHIDCGLNKSLCTEVEDTEIFGHNVYVGHDEPSNLFYSDQAGSGNQVQYVLTLPTDPAAAPITSNTSFNFELHPAFWFGMAMCDTQSAPRPLGDPANPINPGLTCTPDSDSNIHENTSPTAPDSMSTHPGTAFMEMQFYPPGWATWPAGVSCNATQWCAALNIDSLLRDYFHGTDQNLTCQNQVSIEPVNFAFITTSGSPQPNSPPNPVQSTLQTFTPNPAADLFMNSGDQILVTMRDTKNGLRIDLKDLTSGSSGSMTSSAANGFGQVEFDPTGTSCVNLPNDFHPEYSTSSELTRVPWAAHSYNIAFSDEIGHFDRCGNVTPRGDCAQNEGAPGDVEPSDKDDNFCFDSSQSSLVQISGCLDTNAGFDGYPYKLLWPDGSASHPTPIVFTSPVTDGATYPRSAFEADLPRIEDPSVSPFNSCNRDTGAGCINPPLTDDGTPATFYPFYTAAAGYGANCAWTLGSDIPGHTINDFGGASAYGPLLGLTYLRFGGLGATRVRFNDFRQVFSTNPCQP